MKRAIDVPPRMIPVYMDGDGVLVIPMVIYVAGLKLGKALQRRAALAERETPRRVGQWTSDYRPSR